MRIVSLLPSATEIVYALGYGMDLVGVSHECDYPPAVVNLPRMIELAFNNTLLDSEQINARVMEYMKRGESLYRVKVDDLRKANPDLIITQELCDVCAIGAAEVFSAVNQLARPVSIVSLNPHSLKDVKDDIRAVAKALGDSNRAIGLVSSLELKIEEIRKLTQKAHKPRVLCVEWLKPIMNAGHWVPEMVEIAGGIEGLANSGEPSTCVDWNNIVEYDPEVIILMSCGYTTRRTLDEAKRIFDFKQLETVSAVRNGRVFATDGHNYFSRSGPRLFDAVRILAQMIHPELFSEPLDPRLGVRVEFATVSSHRLR